jgi:hypothetical protein
VVAAGGPEALGLARAPTPPRRPRRDDPGSTAWSCTGCGRVKRLRDHAHGQGRQVDKLVGLRQADDYITKPPSPVSSRDQGRAAARPAGPTAARRTPRVGGLTIDLPPGLRDGARRAGAFRVRPLVAWFAPGRCSPPPAVEIIRTGLLPTSASSTSTSGIRRSTAGHVSRFVGTVAGRHRFVRSPG